MTDCYITLLECKMAELDTQDHDIASELYRITAKIDKLVETKRKSGSPEYFFSQLGNDLGKDKATLEKITKKRLSEYLTNDMKFEICLSGVHKNILSVKLKDSESQSSSEAPQAIPRFNKRFWAAFFVPVEAGERRFINLDTCEFSSDIDALNKNSGDVREIDPSYILTSRHSNDRGAALSNIKRWLEDQSLPETQFVLKRGKRDISDIRSPMDQILAVLNDEQKRRISLPLDIIEALSKKR